MSCSGFRRSGLVLLLVLGLSRSAAAQGNTIPFTSGPIPPCDTSVFTADAWGVGTLYPPGWGGWGTFSLVGVEINITTDHPEFLQIILTSPEGTSLVLSEFNGAGGQNYTATNFIYGGWADITTGTAPFTGLWAPQGGGFDVFDYEDGSGTWTITVIDTACAGGPNPGTGNPDGSGWNPGWFDGSSNNGGFTIAFNGPPPCMGGIPSQVVYLCPGETTDIPGFYATFGAGYTYEFLMPDNWTPIPDPTAVSDPGQYGIQAYDPWDGCVYWATYDVYAVPEIHLGPDQMLTTCGNGVPVNLTTLFPLNGWETSGWTFNGSTISNFTAMAASAPGVYQIIAYNGGNCGDTAVVTLDVVPEPDPGPDQQVGICTGGSTDLTALFNTAGFSSVQWLLNGNPIPPPVAATEPGNYVLNVMTALLCTGQAEVILYEDLPPILGADQSITVCDNTTLDLTSLFTTGVLTASWTLAGANVPDPTSVGVPGTYQLVVQNAAGCTDTVLVNMANTAAPSLGPDVSAGACAGNTVDLTAQFNASGLGTIWTDAGSVVPDPTGVSVAGVFSVVATNAAGCSDAASVNVTISPNPVLGPDQQVTECDGVVVDLTALFVTGTNATTWTETGVPVPDATAVANAGSYTLTATNAAGCTASAIVTLAFDPTPTLGSDHASAICAGSTFDLGPVYSTAGLMATWTLAGTVISDPSAVDADGNYQIVATNGFGCSDTAVVSLTVNANPSLGADQWFSLCPWQTVDLSSVFPVDGMSALYAWNSVALDDPTAVSDSGVYVITVTDGNDCTDEAMAYVTNIDCLCEADFTADAHCLQDPALFTVLSDSTLLGAQWDFGGAAEATAEIDPQVLLSTEGEVVVTLQATLSCGTVSVQHTIVMRDCADSCGVYIPNAFTPNDTDRRNDSWWWVGECEPEDFLIYIFDRWGELIYSTEDPHAPWDGTYNGVMSQDGVYVYRLAYRMPYQEDKEVIGHVTLLR